MIRISRRCFLYLLAGAAAFALSGCAAGSAASAGSITAAPAASPSAAGSAAANSAAGSASAPWDIAGFTDALGGCLGWGGDAGSSLKSVIATCGLLDWGEDNNAAAIDTDELTQAAFDWLAELEEDQQATLLLNWGGISANAQMLITDMDSMAGILDSAGNPNQRDRYSAENWAAIEQAVTAAIAAAGLSLS